MDWGSIDGKKRSFWIDVFPWVVGNFQKAKRLRLQWRRVLISCGSRSSNEF
jgi:hypothetical protein